MINPQMLPASLRALIERQEAEEQARIQEMQRRREEYERKAEQHRIYNMRMHHNPLLFLQTEGLYQYDPDGYISSQELYQIYRDWCIQEKLPISTPRSFWLRIKEYAPEYAMTYCTITGKDGKRCRGFRGIRSIGNVTLETDEEV